MLLDQVAGYLVLLWILIRYWYDSRGVRVGEHGCTGSFRPKILFGIHVQM